MKWISSYTGDTFPLKNIDEDKSCPANHNCVVKEKCPAIQTLYEKKDSKQSSDKNSYLALNELKSLVCNHKERGFCCEPDSENVMLKSEEKIYPAEPYLWIELGLH